MRFGTLLANYVAKDDDVTGRTLIIKGSSMEPVPKVKIYQPIAILVGVGALIFWLINTFNTGNPLWFLPIQPIFEPSRIIVRQYGTAVTIQRGDPHYAPLTDALNETFSSFANTDLVAIGLSDETLRRYNEEELVIEAYYADDVQFNTSIRMRGVRQLLVPIDGTHADKNYVFFGQSGVWRAGALVVRDSTPIRQALADLGYLNPSSNFP